jgi:pyruvate-formate lyase-activating enzyme
MSCARCSFCICRSAQPNLVSSVKDIEERMLEGIQSGHRSIVFTGGEPTLVKESVRHGLIFAKKSKIQV